MVRITRSDGDSGRRQGRRRVDRVDGRQKLPAFRSKAGGLGLPVHVSCSRGLLAPVFTSRQEPVDFKAQLRVKLLEQQPGVRGEQHGPAGGVGNRGGPGCACAECGQRFDDMAGAVLRQPCAPACVMARSLPLDEQLRALRVRALCRKRLAGLVVPDFQPRLKPVDHVLEVALLVQILRHVVEDAGDVERSRRHCGEDQVLGALQAAIEVRLEQRFILDAAGQIAPQVLSDQLGGSGQHQPGARRVRGPDEHVQ